MVPNRHLLELTDLRLKYEFCERLHNLFRIKLLAFCETLICADRVDMSQVSSLNVRAVVLYRLL